MTKQAEERRYPRKELDAMMEQIFDGEVYAQRLASLCDGVDGVLHAAQLGIRAIGRGLAAANGLCPKSASTVCFPRRTPCRSKRLLCGCVLFLLLANKSPSTSIGRSFLIRSTRCFFWACKQNTDARLLCCGKPSPPLRFVSKETSMKTSCFSC